MKKQAVINKQLQLNNQLAFIFQNQGITQFRITALGNSIAAGYSSFRTIKPLLMRNETLSTILESYGISYEMLPFARAQNNNDEHVNDWILNNIALSEIIAMNLYDYGTSRNAMRHYPQKLTSLYYSKQKPKDIHLQDKISEANPNLANIIIYSGATGSFLDIWSRGGKIKHHLTYGIKRDIISLHTVLKQIQNNNRNGGSTQVYICGAPNILGIGATEIINRRLRKVVKQYANTTYVSPVFAKGFYKSLPTDQEEKSHLCFDIHYDELEYLNFNNNIIEAIIQNYPINQAMIELDRVLYRQSQAIEFDQTKQPFDLESSLVQLSDSLDETRQVEFFKNAKAYLEERKPYDYFYIGNNALINSSGAKTLKKQ